MARARQVGPNQFEVAPDVPGLGIAPQLVAGGQVQAAIAQMDQQAQQAGALRQGGAFGGQQGPGFGAVAPAAGANGPGGGRMGGFGGGGGGGGGFGFSPGIPYLFEALGNMKVVLGIVLTPFTNAINEAAKKQSAQTSAEAGNAAAQNGLLVESAASSSGGNAMQSAGVSTALRNVMTSLNAMLGLLKTVVPEWLKSAKDDFVEAGKDEPGLARKA